MLDKFKSCLLSGGIGDALGYPIEFLTKREIINKYGDEGLKDLIIDKELNKSLISDDTQMTLFTAEGIILAHKRCSERGIGSYVASGIYQSYLRWLYTQTGRIEDKYWLEKNRYDGERFILDVDELYVKRAPGNTCLFALENGIMGTMDDPINDSKGCGGAMRVAPIGLFLNNDPEYAFRVGCEAAAITHGNATGYLSAGTFAMIIAMLLQNETLEESVQSSLSVLKGYKKYKETYCVVQNSLDLAYSDINYEKAINEIGEGWVAEETLAIAVYCAIKEKDFKKSLIMAVNHDGDSDSTGAICGNILGAMYGMEAVPKEWINKLELSNFIEYTAERLYKIKQI